MRGRRSKANAQGTLAPRSSTGWGSGEALFKGGTSNRPKRTMTWKLGVDAKFETGGFQVPSFSRTFSGAKTMLGGKLGIVKIHQRNYIQIFTEDWFSATPMPRG